jgi:hypothetical protein
MTRKRGRKLMICIAVVALLAGAAAAVVTAAAPATHHRRGTLATAAAYLGLNRTRLRSELHAGKTLAQIADASSGKSEAGLIEALVAAKKTAIVASVKAGTITQAQAESREGKLVSRVRARVQRTRRARTALRRTRGARPALRG